MNSQDHQPSAEELIELRIDQATFAASLDRTTQSHEVRIWQTAPIRGEETAVLPVRPGHEETTRQRVSTAISAVDGPGGCPPRNAIGLLRPDEGRRGMRLNPTERASWPAADLYLEFMPAGSDMVYAHYALAYQILAEVAPSLCDARWYALLSQCEDIVDIWEIADGSLRFERFVTKEDRGRELLALLDPSLDIDPG